MPMKMRLGLSAAVAAAGVCGMPGVSRAVINHPAEDALIPTIPQPPGAVVGRWDVDGAANASAVAIAPNFVLTTRHQASGTVGSIVQFGGTRYRVAQIDDIGTADLRVVRITQEFSAAPANLSAFTPLFTGDDDGSPALPVTFGGYGRFRGTTLLDPSNDPYGYNWDLDGDNNLLPDNVNVLPVRFGRNLIEGSDSVTSPYPFPSDVLLADFDGPGVGGAVPGESAISEFDSGGGWFVEVAPGDWRAAALSLGVDHTGANMGQPGMRSLFAEFSDADVPAPDLLAGVRLSSYANEINAIVPEPSAVALLALGGASITARWRRR
jgi:hypothetical protein